jgi:hypothetical protein
MKNARRRSWRFLFVVLLILAVSVRLEASEFLFTWKASPDPSISAYGIYQRIGDSSYVMIDEVRVQDLEDPANPAYRVAGLADGSTYWFATTSVGISGTESDLSNQTCITVNGQIVECTDDDENGTTVYVSCFIMAAGL